MIGIQDQDMAVVMVTVDRSPEKNYLSKTLENLFRSDSLGVHVVVCDSGSDSKWIEDVLAGQPYESQVTVDTPTEHRCANLNVARALRLGAEDYEWVLFLEDDIDVCYDFFNSTSQWVADHQSEDYRVYPLGANYIEVLAKYHQGKTSWKYPIVDFYGTQAFVLRAKDAISLAQYLEEDPYRVNDLGTAWDIVMHSWMKEKWLGHSHFLSPVPSFVQHIGMNSVVQPRDEIHIFPSYPGRNWYYGGTA